MSANRKPRILIAMHYLELGGAETALVGLLDALSPDRVDVDLFIYSHRGPLMQQIPSWVNLLPEDKSYRLIDASIKEIARRGHFRMAFARWRARRDYMKYIRATHHYTFEPIYSFIGKRVSSLLPPMGRGRYDLAISFMHPHNYLLDHVDARRKMAWIHTDYSTIRLAWDIERPVWSAFDYVAALSRDTAAALVSHIPDVEKSVRIIDNPLPVGMIRRRAEDGNAEEFEEDCFNLLSVGRFCDAKNFTAVPYIMKEIIRLTGRNDLRWYIIGEGNQAIEASVREAIARCGMEQKVFLLGRRDNPYPYMKACSLYVQPSRYEGRAVTVREAQVLGRPVAITAYPTSASQIVDGEEGIIVPLEAGGAAAGIAALISDREKLDAIASVNAARDFSGRENVEKIYSILEDERF